MGLELVSQSLALGSDATAVVKTENRHSVLLTNPAAQDSHPCTIP